MKKNLILILSVFLVLAGCNNNTQPTTAIEVDESNRVSSEGLSIEAVFHEQLMDTQYISDLRAISSPRIWDLNEGESINSSTELNAIFDENSAIEGGFNYSSNKNIAYNGDENTLMNFDIQAASHEEGLYPFGAKGSLSLVHEGEKTYAKINNFSLESAEEDNETKMYALIVDLFVNKWIDLQSEEGGIISITEDLDLPYTLDFLETMLESPDLDTEGALNFTFSVAEVLGAINNYINLGFSTEGLNLISSEKLAYSEFSDGTIQKAFTGSFMSNNASFNFAFVASQKGIDMKIYNIIVQNDGNTYPEYDISLQEVSKSNYEILFNSKYEEQELSNIDLTAEFNDGLNISGTYKLSSMEFIGQDISGTLNGKYARTLGSSFEMPEISGDVMTLEEALGVL